MAINNCKICGGQLSEFIKNIFDDRHGYPGKFDIYRCVSCGFGQTVPEISEGKISNVYTEYYPRKNIDLHEMKKQPLKLMSSKWRWWMGVNNTAHYHIKPGSKVLDIGCGDCTSIREINAMGVEGYGIEPDENVKQIAEEFGLNVHIGLFNEINYPDNYFEYITMSQVMEHIHKPVELLTSLRRVLKEKGQIIIGVPNIDSRLRKKYQSRWLNWHVPYHINHFSRKSILSLAGQSGYRVREIRTITPNLWVDWQVELNNYPVREGLRVPFLNGESEPPPENLQEVKPPGKIAVLANKIKGRVQRLVKHLHVGRIILLRIFDSLGKGESYLVFLEKI